MDAGAVSLAAALALPVEFPGRDLVLFLTFCVIFVILVGKGLTLQPPFRWLDIHDDGASAKEKN